MVSDTGCQTPYNSQMDKDSQSRRLWRLSAMGFTFVSMIIGGGLLGWAIAWVFGQTENDRTFIVTGAVLGIVVGMVDFIRDALKAVSEDSK